MYKKLVILPVLIAILYLIGFIGNAFLFILLLNVSFLYLLYFITSETWSYLKTKSQAQKAVVFFLLFSLLVGWSSNHFLFPDKFHPISIAGNAGILLFALFLGWGIWKKSKKSLVVTGSVIFVLFIFILTVWKSVGQPQEKADPGLAIQSIPYLSYVVNDKQADKSGVIKIDTNRVCEGFNVYNSFRKPGAYLVDMTGTVLHKWLPKQSHPDWFYVTMAKNGDLLVGIRDIELLRLDWDSNVIWRNDIRCHHDIAIAENNDIYTLSRKDKIFFMYGIPVPILNDYLVMLSPEGKIKKEFSLYNILEYRLSFENIKSIYSWMLNPLNCIQIIKNKFETGFVLYHDIPFDVFHNNTVTIVDKDVDGFCKKGNILISSRDMNTVGIVDLESEKLIWSWGPRIINKQHHPTFLENGNILIFDNGRIKKQSRVIELDPIKEEIVWEYKDNPPEQFFTSSMGASQRLENGNTLITESAKGRVIEVTPDNEIVWEFLNPDKTEDGKRIVIYRMQRITDPENYPVLEEFNDVVPEK